MKYQSRVCIITFLGEPSKDKCKELMKNKEFLMQYVMLEKKNASLKRRDEVPKLASGTNEFQLFSR